MVSTASDGEELKVIQKVTVLRNEKRQGGFGSFFLQYIQTFIGKEHTITRSENSGKIMCILV